MAQIASISVAVLGGIVLFGWFAGIPTLQRLHPALASMKVNTALSLALLGLALRFSVAWQPSPRAARVLAAAALAIAAGTLFEYATGFDLGIDELLSRDHTANGAPGRMSPATDGCIVLLGMALLWLESRRADLGRG